MPALSVPEPHQIGLQKIWALPPGAVDELVAALANLTANMSLKDKVAIVSEQVRTLQGADIERVVSTIESLHQVRAHLDVPAEEFVSDIILAVRADGKRESRDSTEDEGLLRQRLQRFLSIGSLATSAKAKALERDHSFLFHDARILTDMRPVFGASVNDAPVGVVVAHTLKVVYHAGPGQHKELYVALDSQDLLQLKKVIERAEVKDRSLRDLLAGKDIKVF